MRLFNARKDGAITQSEYNALASHKTEPTGALTSAKAVNALRSLKAYEAETKKKADAALADANK